MATEHPKFDLGPRVRNTPGPISNTHRRAVVNKKLVPGVDNDEVEVVLAAVHVLWMMGSHKLPTVRAISERATQIDPDRIVRILKHKRFRSLALGRGIQWPENWNESLHNGAVLRSQLRPEQAHVLAIMLEPSRDTFQQRLRTAGINAATWMGWLNDPMFAEAVKVSSENMLGASQASIHASVINGASAGNVQAQRLYYELTGRHDPMKQQMQDMQNVVKLLLEILTRHVTDPIILQKVTSDMDRVMGGHNLREIDLIPANYVALEPPVVGTPIESTVEPDELPDDFFEFAPED